MEYFSTDDSSYESASDSNTSSKSELKICYKPSKLAKKRSPEDDRGNDDFSVGNGKLKKNFLEKLLDSHDAKDKVMLNLIVTKIMKHDHKQAFEFLIEHGYKVDNLNDKNQTAIHLAIYNNSLDILNWAESFLLSKCVDSHNCIDSNGLSYLHFACMVGKKKVLKRFLDEKHDINARWLYDSQEDRDGFTPLHFAVMNHKAEIVKLLLKHGANVNLTDSSGRTPLHHASFVSKKFLNCGDAVLPTHPEWNSELKILKLLVEHGADLSLRDKLGNTPLLSIFKRDNYQREIYSEFDHGVILKEATVKQLHERQKEKFDFLLEHGADVTATADNNESIIHRIIGDLMPMRLPIVCSDVSFDDKLHAALVEQILKSNEKIDVNLKNNQGETPLQQALQFISIDIFKLLLNYKADLSSITFNHQAKHFFRYPLVPPNVKAIRNLLDILKILSENEFELTLKDKVTIVKFLTHSYEDCECMDIKNFCVLKCNWIHVMNYGTPYHIMETLESIRSASEGTDNEYLIQEIVLLSMYKHLKLCKLAKMPYCKAYYNIAKEKFMNKYFSNKAKKELTKMKSMRLNQVDRSTVYHLFTHDHILIYDSIKKTSVDVLSKKLNYYGELLRGRIALSLIINYVITTAPDFLRALTFSRLSTICCETIIRKLAWEDIIHVCIAVTVEDSNVVDN